VIETARKKVKTIWPNRDFLNWSIIGNYLFMVKGSVRSNGDDVNGFAFEMLAEHLQIVAVKKLVHPGKDLAGAGQSRKPVSPCAGNAAASIPGCIDRRWSAGSLETDAAF
jgi:hypothetical protein